MAGPSENLTHHHGSHRRKHRDTKRGQGGLTLSNGHGGDHPRSQTGNTELADDVVLAAHMNRIG